MGSYYLSHIPNWLLSKCGSVGPWPSRGYSCERDLDSLGLFSNADRLGSIYLPEAIWPFVRATAPSAQLAPFFSFVSRLDSIFSTERCETLRSECPSHLDISVDIEKQCHMDRLRLQVTQAPHLLRGIRTACDLRLPSCQLWRSSIVRLECSSRTRQVLHPMLYVNRITVRFVPEDGKNVTAYRFPCR